MSKPSKPKPILNQSDVTLLLNTFSKVFATKEEFDELKEKVNNLPTKNEFYSKMDKVMGELKASREDQAVLTQYDQDQFDRLEELESLHTLPHPHFSKS